MAQLLSTITERREISKRMWEVIADKISQTTGQAFQVREHRSVGGGCINQGYRISNGEHYYFVKLNQASQVTMFEAEILGLKRMWETRTIRIPEPICFGTIQHSSYIVLEWLDLGGRGSSQSWHTMGEQLAAMHRDSGSGKFGFEVNNTIGSTPQINIWTDNWVEFWQEHRIGYQLKLAKSKGGNFPLANQILAAIPRLLAGHDPQPSLVHGDLWGGNASVTREGEPVIFDPATYFGDREVDLAMTELFGGFSGAFYQGYNEVWPMPEGYERRKTLYNLYHILNHFNLFGGGYAVQANRMMEQLLRN